MKLNCVTFLYNFVASQKQLTWSRLPSRGHPTSDVIAYDKNVYNNIKKYHVDDDLNLEIKDITMDDDGQYVCGILPDNINLTIYVTVNAIVNVNDKNLRIYRVNPSFGKQDVTGSKIQVKSKSRIELECKDISNGPAKVYQWVSTAQIKRERGFYVEENGKFVIEGADSHHAGLYQCIAENEQKGGNPETMTERVEISVECKYSISFCERKIVSCTIKSLS